MQLKTSPDPDYYQRVTANDGGPGEQSLRDFQDNEKDDADDSHDVAKALHRRRCAPHRNIVLMRPINSMIEFKQMQPFFTQVGPEGERSRCHVNRVVGRAEVERLGAIHTMGRR